MNATRYVTSAKGSQHVSVAVTGVTNVINSMETKSSKELKESLQKTISDYRHIFCDCDSTDVNLALKSLLFEDNDPINLLTSLIDRINLQELSTPDLKIFRDVASNSYDDALRELYARGDNK